MGYLGTYAGQAGFFSRASHQNKKAVGSNKRQHAASLKVVSSIGCLYSRAECS